MRDDPVARQIAGSMLTETSAPHRPALVVDPVDHLLADVALGRSLPGDVVHALHLAEEHALTAAEAVEAVETAWFLGVLTRGDSIAEGRVAWTPGSTEAQVHRLARSMVSVARRSASAREAALPVIDGEGLRLGAAELFDLRTPDDLVVFLELAHALLGRSDRLLVDDLVAPVAILFSRASQETHGIEFAAPPAVRDDLVRGLVRSLIDGRADDFADLVDDYLLALSVG
jgi:hypothetical protein